MSQEDSTPSIGSINSQRFDVINKWFHRGARRLDARKRALTGIAIPSDFFGQPDIDCCKTRRTQELYRDATD